MDMLVREIMSRRPVTVSVDATVREALAVLAEHRVTALPVLDRDGALVGVLSEGDLVRDLVGDDPRAHARPAPTVDRRRHLVSEVMAAQPVTVRPATDVSTAVRVLVSRGFKSLPVLDDAGDLVGVVSRSDVVRVLARSDEEIARQVDAHLVDVGLGRWAAEVRDGEVTLVGPPDAADRALAHRIASTVPGVVQVIGA